ncbi:MAG: hypothetical protein A2731_00095 [Candidatus Buchananbacteria bacterium RIFCSPHIGHO2_01_FULL_39_8]|uniref:GerMN domain-containing protein n=1 Tax=Candidatus Buchananbacteria bacterium RIFCSPHIGHO2_01_FULL_39_8 TaxID=1797533 RepID=A0A1G1XW93_9BACT|nr:hypothetical protein [uncultured bacterium]OGY44355.1 MAG: hypothetical protein A2731_00095 [Candidatus Buchananbacteria bacterium RIFCSPHIGHO2_01_FULL_39_8]
MKKIITFSIIIIVLVIAFVFFIRGSEDTWLCVDGEWVKHGSPSIPKPTTGCNLADSEINSFQDCIDAGNPVMESYPRQCRANGKTFTEDIGNELEKTDLIQVSNPRPNQTISSPLVITGQARGYWFFEASFPIKLLDENNNEIAIAIAQAQSDWMTENFVPFEATLEFVAEPNTSGWLVLEKDNPSGLPENADELRMPVIFGQSETTTIKVFFNNDKLDPEYSCNKVFPIERTIPKTQAVGQAALEQLLQGPTEQDKADGYFTSINQGVEIQSLTIQDGIAMVDFDQQIEFQVGGSCRVSAIRAQITETLKQFPTVNQVIIAVDGRTEDILQP